jgi:predicted Ser/Thr protein kinase
MISEEEIENKIPLDQVEMSTTLIGSGGFGRVYSGVYKTFPIAIKKIEKERFSREASLDEAKFLM